MRRSRTRALLLAGWTLWGAGCAAAVGPAIDHDEREVLRSPRFDFSRLKTGGLAVLGVTSGAAPLGIREDVSFVIDQAIGNALPPRVTLVPRAETLARAERAGMTQDLQRLIREYGERGALDGGLLRRIAALEEVRYFFATSIVEYQQLNREVGALTQTVFTMPPNLSGGRRYERVQRVRLRGELWDGRCGDVVWIGEGATEVVEDPANPAVPPQDVVAMAATNLASLLPKPSDARSATQKECG